MNRKTLLLVCVAGFLIRALYIVLYNPEIQFPDEQRFWEQGENLLNEKALGAEGKRAHDMPLTAFFVAIGMLLTNGSVLGVKLLFALVSAVTIGLVGILAHAIGPYRYTALSAAIICAGYPFFIFYSSLILSETLFLCFVVTLFIELARRKESRYWQSGLYGGLAHLTRPTLIYFIPIAWVWHYLTGRVSMKAIVTALIVFLMLIVPWGVRNNQVLGEFHLTTTGSGQVLWEGNNPWNKTGGVSGTFSDSDAYLDSVPKELSELEADNWKKNKALEYIENHPIRFIELSLKRFVRFWNFWPNSPDYSAWKYKIISVLSFVPVLFLAVIGVVSLRKHFRNYDLIVLFTVYYTLIHIVTIGSLRYRLPVEPLLVALAGAALGKWFEGRNGPHESANKQ